MLCAISGEAPQVPVASKKSGNVFEKRLIEQYISENGTDPVNGEDLTVEDLIDLQTSRIVRPRPPTLTSIPSLLATFQNEWDALMLETFNLKKQLAQTRQELTTALYQNDAATRVIARLTTERNDAREALSKVSVSAGGTGSAGSNGDAMQIDSQSLPEKYVAIVEGTQEKLSKSRRKRPAPHGWATSEQVESYTVVKTSESLYSGASALAVEPSAGQEVIVGTSIYSLDGDEKIFELSINGKVTDSVWCGGLAVISSTSGEVKAFNKGQEVHSLTTHAGEANALAVHPSGEFLVSVGVDKSFVFYDMSSGQSLNQVFADSALTVAAFHPDGHIFAAGGVDGQIKLFHTISGELAATFECGGPIQALEFSENGTWFAAVVKGSSSVVVFDLRKEGQAARVKELDTGRRVDAISWDYTGSFLATAGPGGITVQQYTKSSKAWSVPFTNATPATAVEWGPKAQSLICVNEAGEVSLLSTETN